MTPFIQNLLQVSISMAVVLGIVLLLVPLWQRRYSARWRKVIWLVMAVRLLIPFSLQLPSAPVQLDMDLQSAPAWTEQQTGLPEQSMNSPAVMPGAQNININNHPVISPMGTGPASTVPAEQEKQPLSRGVILFGLWLAGMLAVLLYHGVQYGCFRRKALACAQPLEDSAIVLQQAAADLNLRRYPAVLVTSQVQGPMLLGYMQPIILLPERIYNQQELLLILRHELMHHKQHDLWYKLILLLTSAVHWFNPLVHWMNRQANRDVEQVCDELVVQGQDMAYRKAYSMTILNTMASQRGIVMSTYLSREAQNSKKRFAAILQPKAYKRGAVVLAAVIFLAVMISGCLQFAEPMEGSALLKQVKDYLPRMIDFTENTLYETMPTIGESLTAHIWIGYDENAEIQSIPRYSGLPVESYMIQIVTDSDQKRNIKEYNLLLADDYAQAHLPEVNLSQEAAKELAGAFLADLSDESDLQLESWGAASVNTFYSAGMSDDEVGWIADSKVKDYHYEIIVNTRYGFVTSYRNYFDNESQRQQMTDWLLAEAKDTFLPYPRIKSVSTGDFMKSWQEGQNYCLSFPLQLSYYGVHDARNADSIWGEVPETPEPGYGIQFVTISIFATAPVQEDGNLDLTQCILWINDVDESTGRVYRHSISGLEEFTGKSLNALMISFTMESYNMIEEARDFANMLAAVTNAEDTAAKKQVNKYTAINNISLPKYAYQMNCSQTRESIYVDFHRRYGQFGNDGESHEPVLLSAEMVKVDGSADTLMMCLETVDGQWQVTDAKLTDQAMVIMLEGVPELIAVETAQREGYYVLQYDVERYNYTRGTMKNGGFVDRITVLEYDSSQLVPVEMKIGYIPDKTPQKWLQSGDMGEFQPIESPLSSTLTAQWTDTSNIIHLGDDHVGWYVWNGFTMGVENYCYITAYQGGSMAVQLTYPSNYAEGHGARLHSMAKTLVLEQLSLTGEEPSFWMYSGYLDEFPDGAGETVSGEFSADYDGDSRQDRVYRQLDEEANTCQYRIEFANGDVLDLEAPISNIGYPQVEGIDLTSDGQNEIIFYVSYPTSTNPLAFGDLAVFEKREERYQQMQLPFMDGTDGYARYLPVVYSKAEGQAVTVSVPGTAFQQTVAIEDSLWNDYQYDTIFTRGDKMEMAVCAYQLRQKDSRHQLVCHVQLFDKWSDWGLDVVLTNAGQQFVIEDILFCDDIYTTWF